MPSTFEKHYVDILTDRNIARRKAGQPVYPMSLHEREMYDREIKRRQAEEQKQANKNKIDRSLTRLERLCLEYQAQEAKQPVRRYENKRLY